MSIERARHPGEPELGCPTRFPVKVSHDVYPRPEHRYSSDRQVPPHEPGRSSDPLPGTHAPEGSPNVLLVVLDDVGYGWSSAFGGLVETPTAQRLADDGLRYCQFHTTGLGAFTRAVLLTGRNHQHFAASADELQTGLAAGGRVIPKSCVPVAEILRQNGYATGWWGKNDNLPEVAASPAGPFDHWPVHLGFDYFYGFLAAKTDQFYPSLYRGVEPIETGRRPEEGYHLTRDLADDCQAWLRRQKTLAPQRPVFMYFAPGAAHAPHQPPLDWRGRHAGRFALGWDHYRAEVGRRQIELGVVPPGTRPTARPKEIPAWEQCDPRTQHLFARFAENYADFLQNADHEVGRLIDTLAELGERDNTLVLYVIGDTGSSPDGSPIGTLNEMHALNGHLPKLEDLHRRVDDIGLPGTSPHYPAGWAWAGDTPARWNRQAAANLGGTRNGLIVSWPGHITDGGALRFQFHHAVDIVPTLLEVVGIREPSMVNGVVQRPVEGVSMAYTFDPQNAASPSVRYWQYFESPGGRAFYFDGWLACCLETRSLSPWLDGLSAAPRSERWELYNVADDFSHSEDLAAALPDRLRDLQQRLLTESARTSVLPLEGRAVDRGGPRGRRVFDGRRRVTFYAGMTRLPEGSAPRLNNVNHTITVVAEIPPHGRGAAEGVLVCLGGDTAGWSLYLRRGRLVYHYNWFDLERYEVSARLTLPPGRVELKVVFENETLIPGGPATVRLFADGVQVASGRIPKQVRSRFGVESLDIGMDALSPVSPEYRTLSPFAFTGTIEHVIFELGDPARRAEEPELIELTAVTES